MLYVNLVIVLLLTVSTGYVLFVQDENVTDLTWSMCVWKCLGIAPFAISIYGLVIENSIWICGSCLVIHLLDNLLYTRKLKKDNFYVLQ